jgi:hypothetical protein
VFPNTRELADKLTTGFARGQLMIDLILAIATAIVIAVISSWVTAYFSLRRYHSERWWDRKAEAYTAVIEALYNSKAYSDDNLNAEMRGREVSQERHKELRTQSRKANDEIQKAIDIGSFLLSEEAMKRLKRYKKEGNRASEERTWFEYLDADSAATGSCLKDMVEIAGRDLRPKTKFFGWLR